MLKDRFNGEHSTTDAVAVASYEGAVFEFLSHRPGAAALLDAALARDENHVASLALKGFGHVLLARKEHMASARMMATRARKAADRTRASDTERALAQALDLAAKGDALAASDILTARLSDAPDDLVAFKIAHALRFLGGDQAGLLALSSGIIDRWSPKMPGFGFVQGCHAFALEEHGLYRAAETCALRGLRHEPNDVWGLHAISHVHAMESRCDEGIRWLEQSRPVWSLSNNFAFHLSWHLGLLHLARGDGDEAVALYDAELRPCLSDDFRDIANAVSILWQLRQEGVDIGDRFCELHGFATLRARDATLVFSSLHHLLTLVACDDIAGIQALVYALSQSAERRSGDQSAVAQDVGLELARTIATLAAGPAARADVARLARMTPRIGGSNEQRDVILRTLALIAADNGDADGAAAVLAIRSRLKIETRFAALVAQRLDSFATAAARKNVA